MQTSQAENLKLYYYMRFIKLPFSCIDFSEFFDIFTNISVVTRQKRSMFACTGTSFCVFVLRLHTWFLTSGTGRALFIAVSSVTKETQHYILENVGEMPTS